MPREALGGRGAGPAERTHEDSEGQAGRGLPRLLAPGVQGCVQSLPQPKLRVPTPPPLPSLALVTPVRVCKVVCAATSAVLDPRDPVAHDPVAHDPVARLS